jgi:hypothetical protein
LGGFQKKTFDHICISGAALRTKSYSRKIKLSSSGDEIAVVSQSTSLRRTFPTV